MALAGLNHKLAGNNLSAHDIPGILICSIYVGSKAGKQKDNANADETTS